MAGMRSLAEGDVSPSHTTTSFMGLKLYAAILVLLGVLLAISLLIFLYYRRKKCSSVRPKKSNHRLIVKHNPDIIIPVVSKEIITTLTADSSGSTPTKKKMGEILIGERLDEVRIMEEGKGSGGGGRSTEEGSAASASEVASVVSVDTAHSNNIGWGRWYSLRELETATSGFDSENVIGEGGYGIVYRGVLEDGSVVAVKNLLNNKGQAQKEFEVEVEAIGRVRHKNLVGLIGYCAEGAQRMLVYEFVDNGNLEQWLHGDVGPVSPLTWDIRMKIAIGTAKGLAYLHEGLEPKVVHRDVKSSNILLDKNWNPKVSDFGLAKLLGSDASYVTTRVMGTFGYVSPEYASTGMLNEGSDVYSFGVLLMELITGRSPVDYARPPGEINLVDWFKGMVATRRGEEVLDPLVKSQPSPRVMKRALLVCLRCIDMDAAKRPKMGQIVHMLEADEFPFRSDHRATARESPAVPLPPPHQSSVANKWLLPRKDVEVRGA